MNMLSMLDFFTFYQKDYTYPDFNPNQTSKLDLRFEDIFFNIWKYWWTMNIPYNERELFN